MALKWKDTARGSECGVGSLKLSVHRHIHHDPEVWLLSDSFFYDCKVLASKDLAQAKCQATALIQVELEKIIEEIVKPESSVGKGG